jgi:hypothetical protein
MAKMTKPKEYYSFHTRTGEYTGPVELTTGEEIPANSTESKPPYINGDETLVWNGASWVVVKTETFELAESMRQKRNALLAGSDFSQLEDSQTDKFAWGMYRQYLRDIPKQKGFPQTIEWPEIPSSKPVDKKPEDKK